MRRQEVIFLLTVLGQCYYTELSFFAEESITVAEKQRRGEARRVKLLIWYYGWLGVFVVAALAFAAIAAAVVVLGWGDLQEMLRGLKTQREANGKQAE